MREHQRAAQKMITSYGSTEQALLACIVDGLSAKEIGRKFGNSPSNIRDMAKRKGIKIPLDKDSTRHPDHVAPIKSPAKTPNTYGRGQKKVTPKELTASMHQVFESSRKILSSQVEIIDRNHPRFLQAAEEIMRTRNVS